MPDSLASAVRPMFLVCVSNCYTSIAIINTWSPHKHIGCGYLNHLAFGYDDDANLFLLQRGRVYFFLEDVR